MSKHTPGPWKLHIGLDYCDIESDDVEGGLVAQLHGFGPEIEADARLIAAAPELLEALRRLEDRVRNHTGKHNPFDWSEGSEDRAMMESARAAIAKAEGGAP